MPNADTTAIEIGIDGVSIDLNGFPIVGSATCTGTPVSSCSVCGAGVGIPGPNHVTVHNGVIRGMGAEAIKLDWNARVENVAAVFDQSQTGFGAIDVGNESTVVDCSVTSNRNYGIFAGTGSNVTGNLVRQNAGASLGLQGQTTLVTFPGRRHRTGNP